MPDCHIIHIKYKKIEICVHGVKNSLINSSTVLLLSSKHMQIMIILKVEGVFLGKIQFLHFLEKELHDFMIKVRKKIFFTTARYMYWYDLCTYIFYKRELVKLLKYRCNTHSYTQTPFQKRSMFGNNG